MSQEKNQTFKINFPLQDLKLWQKFVLGLKRDNRYFLDDDVQKFASNIVKYSKMRRAITMKQGEVLYRARLHSSAQKSIDTPFSFEEMKAPPPEKATAGRLNPEGIPYLYLASDEYTAVAEVRPWKNATMTVARLELKKDLTIVDVTEDVVPELAPEEAEDWEEGAKITWQLISYTFSMPQQPDDKVSYTPTQYLAEAHKRSDFYGIKYQSALSEKGFNVVLFNSDDAEVGATEIVNVTGVNFDYKKKS